jgi:hypothetical protein
LVEVYLGFVGRVAVVTELWIDSEELFVAEARVSVERVLGSAKKQGRDDE